MPGKPEDRQSADAGCPLFCSCLILGLWGGYKCSRYGLKVSDNSKVIPKRTSMCLKDGLPCSAEE